MPKIFSISLSCSQSLAGDKILLPTEVMEAANLAPGQQVQLGFGKRSLSAGVAGGKDRKQTSSKQTAGGLIWTVALSEDLCKKLLIPAPVSTNLLIDRDQNCLRLGPLIGILANRSLNKRKPFGEQSSFFNNLGSTARNLGAITYAFAPCDIDWQNETIRGTVPPSNNTSDPDWRAMMLPFPDVIYDRGLFPKGEKRQLATEARKKLRNYPGIKFFNPAFFGKWKTHKLLARHELLCKHLPETRLYSSADDIRELLTRHKNIYLKPSGGSSGRGIIHISEASDGYNLTLRVNKEIKVLKGLSLANLEKYSAQLIGVKRYIVQQGLELARVDGSLFDVRVLMQRDCSGNWIRTGMAVRVASPGSFISNIHAGGHAAKISSVLSKVFSGPQINSITNQIRNLSILIAAWITNEYSHLFGEVAIDLGVDSQGKVWIIELNAIPGRSVFRRIHALDILSKAHSRPMEYSLFISGFSPRSIEKEGS